MTGAGPKTRRVWLTDLHLNFVTRQCAIALAEEVLAAAPDSVLFGGDLADAPILADRLMLFAGVLAGIPVVFVLGNHDFYHGSFVEITQTIHTVAAAKPNLRWLGGESVIALSEATTLVSADSWGDGGHNNCWTSVRLNDSVLIAELRDAASPMDLCEALGHMSADHLRGNLCAPMRKDTAACSGKRALTGRETEAAHGSRRRAPSALRQGHRANGYGGVRAVLAGSPKKDVTALRYPPEELSAGRIMRK